MIDLEAEFRQYVETALWSSTDESDEAGGQPMDRNYGPDDIATEALNTMRADLEDFIEGADTNALQFWQENHGPGQVGHDFWLTRNGHGAGFWDRWSGGTPGYEYGRLLTAEAKPYGESDLYVGDDGLIYVS